MATFVAKSNTYNGRYLQLTINQVKNIADNTSTLNWVLESIGGNSNYYTIEKTTVTIDGTQVYSQRKTYWNESPVLFPSKKGSVSGSIVIEHDTYGEKTVQVGFSTGVYTGILSEYGGPFTLDSIPRQATITAAPDFTDVQNPTISYSNPAGETVSELAACISFTGDKADITYRDISKTGTSYTFALTDAERTILCNNTPGTSRTVQFVVRTRIGGATLYSSLTRMFTITESDKTRPGVSLSVSPNKDTSPDIFKGLYIQGKTKVDVALSAQGKYNATIPSYSATLDGKTYGSASFVSDVLTKSGTLDVIGYAEDSRGFTGSASQKITVIPYAVPYITSFSVERQDDGTTVVAHLAGGISPISNKNTKSFSVTLNGVTKEITVAGYNVDDIIVFENVPTDQTLTASARVADWYTAVEKDAVLTTVAVTMDFHYSGTGIAMGKVAEHEKLLDVAWDVSIKGSLTAAHIAPIDTYDDKAFNELIYQTGYYAGTKAPSSAGCSNHPVDKTGVLEVISQMLQNASTGNWWGFAYQTYRTYDGEIYMRSFYTDTGFTAWKKVQFV